MGERAQRNSTAAGIGCVARGRWIRNTRFHMQYTIAASSGCKRVQTYLAGMAHGRWPPVGQIRASETWTGHAAET